MNIINTKNIFSNFPVLLLYIPIIFYTKTLDTGTTPRFLILTLFFFIILLYKFINSIRRVDKINLSGFNPVLQYLLIGYLAISIISFIPAINKSEAIFDIYKIFLFVLSPFFFYYNIKNNSGFLETIGKNIVTITISMSILAILEFWEIFNLIHYNWAAPAATLGNRNLLSSFLFLCLGYIVWGIIKKNGFWLWMYFTSFSLMIYVILISRTRAVWLAITFGIVVTGITHIMIDKKTLLLFFGKYKTKIVTLIILTICIIIFQDYIKPKDYTMPDLSVSIISMADPSMDSNNQRLVLWKKTLSMILDHPFFGVGAGNWKIVLPSHTMSGMLFKNMQKIFQRPHNDYLWAWAEYGFIGLLCYGGLFVFVVMSFISYLKNKNNNEKIMVSCLLITILGYGVISFFDFPKERISHSLYFGLLIGIAASLHKKSTTVILAKPLMITILAILLSAKVFGIMRIKGEESLQRALIARIEGKWDIVAKETERINTMIYSLDHSSTPIDWYKGVAYYSKGDYRNAICNFERACKFHPNHIHVLNNLASCYESLGESDMALDIYKKALRIYKHFDIALVNMSAIYYNKGKYNTAYKTIILCNKDCTDSRRESYLKAIKNKLNKE